MSGDSHNLTQADLVAVRDLIADAIEGRDPGPTRTDKLVDVVAKIAVFAIGNPELTPTEIARRSPHRKKIVLRAVKAARATEATEDLGLPPPSSESRFPSGGNRGGRHGKGRTG